MVTHESNLGCFVKPFLLILAGIIEDNLFGLGDHFQVLKVPERTCTVLRTYLPAIWYCVCIGRYCPPDKECRYIYIYIHVYSVHMEGMILA